MRREYPEAPIAAVGAVVVDDEGRVLLIRRAQEPQKGEWSLPGGAVELGETLEQAICREVLEETGLLVQATHVVEVLDRIVRDAQGVRYHYVLIDWLCRVTGGTLCCATDAEQALWVTEEEIVENRLGVSERALEVIGKALEAADLGKGEQPAARPGSGSGDLGLQSALLGDGARMHPQHAESGTAERMRGENTKGK